MMIGLWMARTISVCLIVEAWWQCACSVLKLNIDQNWLLLFIFVSSALCCWIFAGSGKKLLRVAAVIAAAVLITTVIFLKSEIFAGTLNHIVNGYLRLGVAEDVTIKLFHEMDVTLLQRTAAVSVLLLPLTAAFSAAARFGKGKIPAGILLAVPVLLPTLKVHFPDTASCWFMVLASAVFFAIAGVSDARAAWSRGTVSAAAVLFLITISSFIGGKIEVQRKREGNSYYKVRTVVQENVVDPIEGWLRDSRKKTEKEEDKKQKEKERQKEQQQKEETADVQAADDSGYIKTPWGSAVENERLTDLEDEDERYTAPQDLSGIARFSPKEGTEITVVQDEKPEGMVYQPLWYGGSYSDNSWEELPIDDDIHIAYSQYPRDLSKLIDFCHKNPCTSPEEVENLIDEEFERNLVYDYEPGAVPEGNDFAEYFLFENKKGFCVHFATTAALIYRIYKIPARYVEGYAIPAEAFVLQDDGSYAAQVTGDMGHAWCEIYESGWIVKEHTLPYTGPEREERGPAADTAKEKPADFSQRFLIGEIVFLAAIMIAAAAFFLQAAVRRRKRQASYTKKSRTKALQSLYRNIYDTAVFFGMEEADPLRDRTVEEIRHYCGGFDLEELQWLKEKVQESLFYNRIPSKEEYRKAYDMHQQFTAGIRKRISGFQRIKYRYLLCLG